MHTPALQRFTACTLAICYIAFAPGIVKNFGLMLTGRTLGGNPDSQAKADGIAVGEAAAAAMLLLRANDGWSVPMPYQPGINPGDWQPTPPAFSSAAFTGWGQVTPFGLESGAQFRSPPPPALGSKQYAVDYNEVQQVGRFDSILRPQYRTDVALFFAATSPVVTWNPVARQVSAAQGMTLSQNARVFALLAMAVCDSSIAVFDSKCYYSRWRPVTAIRAGSLDGNRETTPDPN